ncbi:hypothetical protein [Streptomyces montanisoli]|uniref:Uncharacterized protein n=1 Tax=Streptomyces montanisoli TaxID=2798581 RepID=A0A940M9G1_9ACTN|nr:hypothetical protein [Streptomyces montanisoli]MBP0458745.1 hypothetical protein [Streptomyces montanisoli]
MNRIRRLALRSGAVAALALLVAIPPAAAAEHATAGHAAPRHEAAVHAPAVHAAAGSGGHRAVARQPTAMTVMYSCGDGDGSTEDTAWGH